jgi:hypothetical protein
MLIRLLPALATLLHACTQTVNEPLILDRYEDWIRQTGSGENLVIVQEEQIGGDHDLMGNGALCLGKSGDDFHASSFFRSSGRWTSRWLEPERDAELLNLSVSMFCYGQKQDMSRGWQKFRGNPLVCQAGWRHATEQSLLLPGSPGGQPADQALARGTGEWEGKWLLFFNIGGWAVNGWGMAVADSLAPLKRGINPFRLAEPYPLAAGNFGDSIHAPNDFYCHDGTWYAPCEAGKVRDTVDLVLFDGLERVRYRYSILDPTLWTSRDLVHWKNNGAMKGARGHDPGITHDGKLFYLFGEKGESLVCCISGNPLSGWHSCETVLDAGNHTGDPDLVFFNNRWHIFYDDSAHAHYRIGYASATIEDFPGGWVAQKRIFGPHRPDQGQLWDDDVPEGNNFGTGDADVAIEGSTLYMTYEWPVGIAWKELDLYDGDCIGVTIRVETDSKGDGCPDEIIRTIPVRPGKKLNYTIPVRSMDRFRISIFMTSSDTLVSPMITELGITQIRAHTSSARPKAAL